MSLFTVRTQTTLQEVLTAGLADAYARCRAARCYKPHMGHLLAAFGPQTPASGITPAMLETYQVHALGRWKPNTVRHQFAFMSRSYALAIRSGRVRDNPVSGMRVVRPGEHRRVFLYEEQVPALYVELSKQDQDIVTFFIYTGLRRSEAFNLLRCQVGWVAREISVPEGKGCARIVSIHPGLVGVIQDLQNAHSSPYVLPGPRNRVNAVENFYQRFRRACRRAGFEDLHLHDLRHTAAVWLQEAGAPLPVIRDFLGHKNCRTTEIYANVSTTAMRRAVESVRWMVPE